MGDKIKQLGYISLFLAAGFLFSCADETPVVTEQPAVSEQPAGELEAALPPDEVGRELVPDETVFVYVCGSVRNPGVYELDSGARIIDAIEAAGGMDEAAAVSYVNQAGLVTDGQQIYIPTEAEAETHPAGTMPGETGAAADHGGVSAGLVNINTATKEELMQLNGIGEAKAGNIITWREQNGGFEKIEDITKVDGIGDGTFTKLKEYICVS